MDLCQTSSTTEVQSIVGMFQYYRIMWSIRYHMLDPLAEAASGRLGRK